jgi:type VI protein secretion system component VasK
MPTADTFNNIGTIALFLGMPGLMIFVGYYALRTRWHSSVTGRTLLYFAISLLSLYFLGAMNAVFGNDWPFRGALRLLVYISVSATIWRLTIVLLLVQAGVLDKDKLAPPPPHARGGGHRR